MKIKSILVPALLLSLTGLSQTASAGFDFGSPFDAMNNNDNYNRYNRGYAGDRWDQYDQWEPNYWRYRYFDGDSRDNFFDEFNGNSFNNGRSRGQGRGGSDFGMNADSRYNGQYDGYYEGDSRYQGERSRRYDYDRPSNRNRAGRDYSAPQPYSGRNASQRNARSAPDYYGNGNRQGGGRYDNKRYARDRGISETPERVQQRAERQAKRPAECR